jgi:transcriptional regulator NrdR family protein
MKCPNCSAKTRTIDTRQYIEPNAAFYWVFRRTRCGQCLTITRTVEVPQETWTKVFDFYNANQPSNTDTDTDTEQDDQNA